ncbi:hypothetical protein BJ508DRAFT_411020 [Ascobolus immersus RN42]|uniref:Uncharacterized protein n=1 Tax=Ascobolus immersus RN42 TaxID=1160509 RepID=A0A3N4IYX0_ASCIM|nr:hypothetical protein BJ508DRAFT_411020 [Ascobolus immersus RN42]
MQNVAQQAQAALQQQKQQQMLQQHQQQQQHQQHHQHQLQMQQAQQQQQQQQQQPPAPWNEEQTLDALRKLDELRSQITQLRSSIPDMISPFLRVEQMATPQDLFNEFEKQVRRSTAGVASFQQNFNSNRNLFTRATSIRYANPEGITRVEREDRIDFNARKDPESSNDKSEKEKAEAATVETTTEKDARDESDEGKPDDKEPEESLADFRRDNPDIAVEEDFLLNEYKFTLPPPARLAITIKLAGPQETFPPQIVSVRPAKWRPLDKLPPVYTSLERALKSRPNRASFSSLLQHIVTYKWLYDTKCEYCKRLAELKTADMPVLRRGNLAGKRKRVEDEDEPLMNGAKGEARKVAKLDEDGWSAFHESCFMEAMNKDTARREIS